MYNVMFNQTNASMLQALVWWSGAGLSTVLAHPSLPHPLLAWADGFILCFLGLYKLGEYIMKLKWTSCSCHSTLPALEEYWRKHTNTQTLTQEINKNY